MESVSLPERHAPLEGLVRHTETGELIDINSPDYLPDLEALQPGLYEHFKTTDEQPRHYRVHGGVKHRYTECRFVVYEPLYDTNESFPSLRPLEMFSEMVEHEDKVVPRFRYCGSEQVIIPSKE